MPRSSSRGPSRPSPTRQTTTAQAPQKTQQAPPVQQTQSQGGSFMGNMAATMAQGMAFGAGSEIAHRVVGGLMGGSSHQQHQQVQEAPVQQQQQQQNCQDEGNQFSSCLQRSSDINSCQMYMDVLKECQKKYNF